MLRALAQRGRLQQYVCSQRLFTEWASVDPVKLSGSEPGIAANLGDFLQSRLEYNDI
jgi:hypothetical protein